MSTVTDKKAVLNLSISKQREIIRKELSKDEMDDIRTSITNNLQKLHEYQEELDEVKAEYKAKMKPLEKQNGKLLVDIKNGFIDESIEVSLVPDYDNRIVEFYNEEGVKVGERRMMMSELQGTLNLK
jgi:flagellar motility protein MotE (MotC chaperone)